MKFGMLMLERPTAMTFKMLHRYMASFRRLEFSNLKESEVWEEMKMEIMKWSSLLLHGNTSTCTQ